MKCYVFVFFVLFCANYGISYGKTNKNVAIRRSNDTSIKYYIKHNTIEIPVMMHIDKELARTLSKNRTRRIKANFKLLARDILKDVEFLFSKLNLEQKLKFELLDVAFLKNNSKTVVMDENVSNYLNSYCHWQGERKKKMEKWFLSVLFTGLDLFYYDQHGVKTKRSSSRGYMRGICHNLKSCTVLEWRQQNIAFMLAHEIAHSLGVEHDGPPQNECKGQRYVMEASHNPKNPAMTWSACSRRSLVQFLKSEYAWCLHEPRILNYNNFN